MAQEPSVESVDVGDDYYHVRYNDPDDYDAIRTPDWAENPAESVVEGSEVRTGDEEGNDDWDVQSVLVPTDAVANDDEAAQQAQEIVDKIENSG